MHNNATGHRPVTEYFVRGEESNLQRNISNTNHMIEEVRRNARTPDSSNIPVLRGTLGLLWILNGTYLLLSHGMLFLFIFLFVKDRNKLM